MRGGRLLDLGGRAPRPPRRPSEYYEEPETAEAVTEARKLSDWARGHLLEHVVTEAYEWRAGIEDP